MDTSTNSVHYALAIMHIYTKCAKKLKKVLTNETVYAILIKLSHERYSSEAVKKVLKNFEKGIDKQERL